MFTGYDKSQNFKKLMFVSVVQFDDDCIVQYAIKTMVINWLLYKRKFYQG